ncbi:MAG: T9SS type A sorting domain-containing protein [Bacteroidia bacterium]|nr:T9SS type A sorting domain-containing protein [Bacteroidia bacterium]
MNRNLFITLITFLVIKISAQNPGLVISEFFPNPAGTDSCHEFVELIATKPINFGLTPYTIIVNNNGNATTSGWIAGGSITYAFAVTSGTVAAGNVVYVGGSCMVPAGQKLRVINVKNTNGDGGIGTAAAAGVFGNGGANADGVAVFDLPVAAITSSSVPKDALFFGTSLGTAIVNAGVDGYQMPVNDLYSGGKLNTGNFFTTDPGPDVITATGIFNTTNNTWTQPRTFSVTPFASQTNASSSVSLTTSAAPATISFLSNDTSVVESSSSATIYLKQTVSSTSISAVSVVASAWSNATSSDYTIAVATVTFAANAPVNTTASVSINLANDAILESAEYAILKLVPQMNATIGSTNQCTFYILDDDKVAPAAANTISLNLLGSYQNFVSGSNSAEIVVHDPSTQRLYIANSIGGKLDIIDFINPSTPTLIASINITTYGNINSVAVKNGTVACAIENSSIAIGGTNPQDSGKVVFFDKNGLFLKQVKVGMMPDMITFNHAGTKVFTANEGEPNDSYTSDPDGSVSIVDISGGIAALSQTNVAHVTFTVYNGQEPALKSQGIRIYGLGASASKDFEPEYISIAKDDSKAWVTLQENNAIVEINLTNNAINYIKPLGAKNLNLLNNGIDASNVTKGVNIANFPIKGLYLPDAIASYSVGGVNYLVTANEGDSRAYTGFSEEKRISTLLLDATKFPNATDLQNNSVLGRLNATDKLGDTDNDGDIDSIYVYGGRSFSIWNANTGNLVYDSGDQMELITSTNSFSVMFNASNTTIVKKDRSDDKGPEPEGIAIGAIGTNTFAFIAVERIGGIMVYDITNPAAPVYVTYVNNRSFVSNGPDRGAEGIIFIPQAQSPNGQHLVIAANEISSSLSIYGIPGCSSPVSSSLSVAGSTTGLCSTAGPIISVPFTSGLNYQWSSNGTPIVGATSNTVMATASGNYSVAITGGTNCSVSSLSQSVSVNPSPTINVVSSSSLICVGQTATLTASGAVTYSWTSGPNAASYTVNPTTNTTYTVAATGVNSCTNVTSFVQNVSLCTGSNEIVSSIDFNLYPNPARNEVNLQFADNSLKLIEVYDILGKKVYSTKISDNKNLVINVTSFDNGIYTLYIQSDNLNVTKKLIVE